jgi:casein kinase I family protein HRR25
MIFKYLSGSPGIPIFYDSGTEGEFNYLVMELLGPSLEDLFNACHKKFSTPTVLAIAQQMVKLFNPLN